MSSRLRNQTLFQPITAHTTAAAYPHSPSSPPAKKQRMTLTQTYRLAHRARGKLSSEASRGDHDLRLLVGHANLLDSLMLELQDAEREQDAWFEQTVSVAAKPTTTQSSEPKRVQWSDQQQLEIPDASDEEDSDNEDDDEDIYMEDAKALTITVPPRQTRSRSPPPTHVLHVDDDDEDMEYDSDEENEGLTLVRTKSHSPSDEVPELVHDSDDSDDDMSPESPPAGEVTVRDFAQTSSRPEKPLIKTTTIEIAHEDLLSQHHPALIAAY